MYITNPYNLSNTFKCNELVHNYLQKNGFSLLSRDEDGKYLYSNTAELKHVLTNAPVHIRLLIRW